MDVTKLSDDKLDAWKTLLCFRQRLNEAFAADHADLANEVVKLSVDEVYEEWEKACDEDERREEKARHNAARILIEQTAPYVDNLADELVTPEQLEKRFRLAVGRLAKIVLMKNPPDALIRHYVERVVKYQPDANQ